MQRRHRLGLTLGSLLFALPLQVNAHHSMTMFDLTQCLSITGTVRTFQYQYPHSWLWIYVRNAQGGEDVWGFESAAPANLVEKDPRWHREVLKKGDVVTLKYAPLKDGRNGGSMSSIVLPNGVTLPVPAPICGDGPPIPAGTPGSTR